MNNPKNIIVHHTAVSRSKNPKQFEATDNYHKSKGWGGIGYHYLIEADGRVRQGRQDNEAGAHTSQMDMNFFSLGICLTGDFDTEEPTKEQCISLLELIRKKQREYGIPENHVVPHRRYAPKSCWGKLLPDDILGYCRKRTQNELAQVSSWAIVSAEKAKAKGYITNWAAPQDPMKDEDIQHMLVKMRVLDKVNFNAPITREQWACVLDRLKLLD